MSGRTHGIEQTPLHCVISSAYMHRPDSRRRCKSTKTQRQQGRVISPPATCPLLGERTPSAHRSLSLPAPQGHAQPGRRKPSTTLEHRFPLSDQGLGRSAPSLSMSALLLCDAKSPVRAVGPPPLVARNGSTHLLPGGQAGYGRPPPSPRRPGSTRRPQPEFGF